MRGPKSRSYYTGCLVCKAICSSFAYVYVQRGVFVVLLPQLKEEWVSGPLTIPLEWREAVCVCFLVCVEKGPAGELCSEELGEFKGEAFGACLPQCGQEFSQSSHRNVQDSWVTADAVWPNYYMSSITHLQVAILKQIFTCSLSWGINFYASTTGLSFLPFPSKMFTMSPTFCTFSCNPCQ